MSNYIPLNVKNFKVVAGPTSEPVTRKRAKDYLRVSTTTEDGLISSLISAATLHVERITGRVLMAQTIDLVMDAFPYDVTMSGNGWWGGMRDGPISQFMTQKQFIEIWKAPVQSIEFLKTFSVDDSENIFPATNYIVDTNSWPSRIVLRQGQTWPTTNLRTANGIQIRFKFVEQLSLNLM